MHASRFSAVWAALVCLLGAAGGLGLVSAPGAVAATSSPTTGSVTLVGEPGDSVTQGAALRYDTPSSTISLTGTLAHASVDLNYGVSGEDYSFDFVAPSGQTLAPGVYDAPQAYPIQDASLPALAVSGDGRGCGQRGSFVVKDIHADSSGRLDRLWVLYEDQCTTAVPREFGEIKLGEPAPADAAIAEPSAISWPSTDPGRPMRTVPVTLVGGSSRSTISGVALGGADPGDFSVASDGCSGQTLSAGGNCQVAVAFAPWATGDRTAELAVTSSDGSVVDVPLTAFVHAGTTRADLQSDTDDGVGEGLDYAYSGANSTITATGTPQAVMVEVDPGDKIDWNAYFEAAPGATLTAGTTYSPVSRVGIDGGAGLSVTGNGWSCNTLVGEFTVRDIHFDPDGELEDFSASFVQACDGGRPALRGTFQFRAPMPAPLLALNSAPPSVSGDAAIGQTLGATSGSWADPSTAYGYQWQRCTAAGCQDIAGATSPTYTVGMTDVASQLAVESNLTNDAGQSAWVRSAKTAVVAPPPVAVNTALPSAPADPVVGTDYEAGAGTWTNSPSGYAYQWSSCGADECSVIPGVTSSDYQPTLDQVGRRLTVSVIATDDGGDSAPAVSAPSAPVVAPPPPAAIELPTIVGPPLIGSGLGSYPATWSEPIVSSFLQWLECDAAGANCYGVGPPGDPHYVITSADIGHTLRLSETVIGEYSGTTIADSAATTVIPASPTWLQTLDQSTGIPEELEGLAATESLSAPARQSARSVTRGGLAATVGCSVRCAVVVTVTRPASGPTRSRAATVLGTRTIDVAAGRRARVHVRVRHNRPGKLVVTSTAKSLVAPFATTAVVRRTVTVF